jgi:hypothetical protein
MKLKYKFRVYNLLESYPTEEDALFEITNFLQERNRLEEEWSDLGIKGAFSKKITEEETSKLLQSLVDQGFLTMKAGSGKRNYFRIITSPFI